MQTLVQVAQSLPSDYSRHCADRWLQRRFLDRSAYAPTAAFALCLEAPVLNAHPAARSPPPRRQSLEMVRCLCHCPDDTLHSALSAPESTFTTTGIYAWSFPHNSVQKPRYVPTLSALNHVSRITPGIASCLTPNAGTYHE